MAKVKDKDLQLGDVVEFTPNGQHIKLIGTVFKNSFGLLSIQCKDLTVGVAKTDAASRTYKLIARETNAT